MFVTNGSKQNIAQVKQMGVKNVDSNYRFDGTYASITFIFSKSRS